MSNKRGSNDVTGSEREIVGFGNKISCCAGNDNEGTAGHDIEWTARDDNEGITRNDRRQSAQKETRKPLVMTRKKRSE